MAIRTVTRAGVGLVVGIIILGLLVLGGLWLVRERGDQARRAEAITIAEQQLRAESNKDEDVALNNGDDKKEESTAKPGNTSSEPEGVKPTPQTEATPVKPAAPAAELPQTGPNAASFVAAGLLSFAVVSFMRSRKLASN